MSREEMRRRMQQTGDRKRKVRGLLELLRPYRGKLSLMFVALLFATAAALAPPPLAKMAIDDAIVPGDLGALTWIVIAFVISALVYWGASYAQTYLVGWVGQRALQDLRKRIFAHLQDMPVGFYERRQAGVLISRMTNDVQALDSLVTDSIVTLFQASLTLIGTIVILAYLDLTLALLTFLIFPLLFAGSLAFRIASADAYAKTRVTIGSITAYLQETLSGIRVVRSFGQEPRHLKRFSDLNDDNRDANLKTVYLNAAYFPVVELVSALATVGILVYGGLQVINGGLSIGELVAFNTLLGFMLFPILTIGFLSASISRAGASAARVFEILDAPLEVTDKPDASPLPPLECRVEFDDVSFRYPGSEREILRCVSFAVEPGSTVAILGTTGSGKSTLVNLLPRFYDVTGGAVRLDGHDVRDVTLSSLRSQIGMVLQEARLFSGTVRDNVAFGRPDATDEEVRTAAKDAQADGFIQGLPDGYGTVIGERGVGLSGGQRQRIAIARALLVDPRLLILDDSTSAVDAETEAAIQETLDRLMREKHRTVFVIAQRVSTVRDADLILVLDEGAIGAMGTHEELRSTSELYNEILGSQLVDEPIPTGGDG